MLARIIRLLLVVTLCLLPKTRGGGPPIPAPGGKTTLECRVIEGGDGQQGRQGSEPEVPVSVLYLLGSLGEINAEPWGIGRPNVNCLFVIGQCAIAVASENAALIFAACAGHIDSLCKCPRLVNKKVRDAIGC